MSRPQLSLVKGARLTLATSAIKPTLQELATSAVDTPLLAAEDVLGKNARSLLFLVTNSPAVINIEAGIKKYSRPDLLLVLRRIENNTCNNIYGIESSTIIATIINELEQLERNKCAISVNNSSAERDWTSYPNKLPELRKNAIGLHQMLRLMDIWGFRIKPADGTSHIYQFFHPYLGKEPENWLSFIEDDEGHLPQYQVRQALELMKKLLDFKNDDSSKSPQELVPELRDGYAVIPQVSDVANITVSDAATLDSMPSTTILEPDIQLTDDEVSNYIKNCVTEFEQSQKLGLIAELILFIAAKKPSGIQHFCEELANLLPNYTSLIASILFDQQYYAIAITILLPQGDQKVNPYSGMTLINFFHRMSMIGSGFENDQANFITDTDIAKVIATRQTNAKQKQFLEQLSNVSMLLLRLSLSPHIINQLLYVYFKTFYYKKISEIQRFDNSELFKHWNKFKEIILSLQLPEDISNAEYGLILRAQQHLLVSTDTFRSRGMRVTYDFEEFIKSYISNADKIIASQDPNLNVDRYGVIISRYSAVNMLAALYVEGRGGYDTAVEMQSKNIEDLQKYAYIGESITKILEAACYNIANAYICKAHIATSEEERITIIKSMFKYLVKGRNDADVKKLLGDLTFVENTTPDDTYTTIKITDKNLRMVCMALTGVILRNQIKDEITLLNNILDRDRYCEALKKKGFSFEQDA